MDFLQEETLIFLAVTLTNVSEERSLSVVISSVAIRSLFPLCELNKLSVSEVLSVHSLLVWFI